MDPVGLGFGLGFALMGSDGDWRVYHSVLESEGIGVVVEVEVEEGLEEEEVCNLFRIQAMTYIAN